MISNLVTMFTVGSHWLGSDAKSRKLVENLEQRMTELPENEATTRWLEDVVRKHGELLAMKPLVVGQGLAGYPEVNFLSRIFGKGTPAELVIAKRALLFCVPIFAVDSKIEAMAFEQVRSASIDFYDGSTLVIKTGGSTIKCETAGTLDAKPVANLIEQMKTAGQ